MDMRAPAEHAWAEVQDFAHPAQRQKEFAGFLSPERTERSLPHAIFIGSPADIFSFQRFSPFHSL